MAKVEGHRQRSASGMDASVNAELHWYEAHGIGTKDMKAKALSGLRHHETDEEGDVKFAVCINNEDYLASLELWKVYRVLPDEDAARA